MGVKIVQVDAFTDHAFSGNPAAVCILEQPGDEGWMQKIAQEMNLSETAFLHRDGKGFRLRWFTPAAEVELCGHATLASAHVLWETHLVGNEQQILFHTKSGVLTAERRGAWIELDFPAEREQPTEAPDDLLRGLGIQAKYVGKNRFDYLVEIDSEEILKNMEPDFTALMKVPARGIIVTCRASTADFDFISRFFAPLVGVNEDPVTGSAHCCLGPFWGSRLNKDALVGYQASMRGGVVRVSMKDDRVRLAGQAVTVLRGEILA